MKLHVKHQIAYVYSAPVTIPPQQILMRPRVSHLLSVPSYRFTIEPEAKINWTRDHRDNAMAIAFLWKPIDRIRYEADFEVETFDDNPFDFTVRLDAVRYPFEYAAAEAAVLAPFRDETVQGRSRQLLPWLRTLMKDMPENTMDVLTLLNRSLREQLDYRTRFEQGVQSPEETIRNESGTCRDFAWLMVVACQALGFAARFVSGYLYDASVDAGAEAGSLHAWVEVYVPGAGWKGLDPTHAVFANDHFIPVAVGRGPENLNPITGAFFGQKDAQSEMTSSVEISPR